VTTVFTYKETAAPLIIAPRHGEWWRRGKHPGVAGDAKQSVPSHTHTHYNFLVFFFLAKR